jgi:hypothetical protein
MLWIDRMASRTLGASERLLKEAAMQSREIQLKRRPVGKPVAEDFTCASRDVPPPAEGEVQVRNLWMAVDPAQREKLCAAFRARRRDGRTGDRRGDRVA